MLIYRVKPATIITRNRKTLLGAWRQHGGPGSIVGTFVCEAALTPQQLRRLPKGLLSRLQHGLQVE